MWARPRLPTMSSQNSGMARKKVMMSPNVAASTATTKVNVTAPNTTSVTRWVRVHHVDA